MENLSRVFFFLLGRESGGNGIEAGLGPLSAINNKRISGSRTLSLAATCIMLKVWTKLDLEIKHGRWYCCRSPFVSHHEGKLIGFYCTAIYLTYTRRLLCRRLRPTNGHAQPQLSPHAPRQTLNPPHTLYYPLLLSMRLSWLSNLLSHILSGRGRFFLHSLWSSNIRSGLSLGGWSPTVRFTRSNPFHQFPDFKSSGFKIGECLIKVKQQLMRTVVGWVNVNQNKKVLRVCVGWWGVIVGADRVGWGVERKFVSGS